jgi:hypothetical protein
MLDRLLSSGRNTREGVYGYTSTIEGIQFISIMEWFGSRIQ